MCGGICSKTFGGCKAFSFDKERGVCKIGTFAPSSSPGTGETISVHVNQEEKGCHGHVRTLPTTTTTTEIILTTTATTPTEGQWNKCWYTELGNSLDYNS